MGAPALTAIAAIETAPTPHCAATAIALSMKLFSLNLANLTMPNRIPILFESVKRLDMRRHEWPCCLTMVCTKHQRRNRLLTPPFIASTRFDDPRLALEQVQAIYRSSIEHLRDALQRFVAGEDMQERVRACYPFVRIQTDTVARADSPLAYGFVAGPGVFETTLTRPDLFDDYYLDQFTLLLKNHNGGQRVHLEVG